MKRIISLILVCAMLCAVLPLSSFAEDAAQPEIETAVSTQQPIIDVDPNADSDGDGLTDAEETDTYRTSPDDADTDNDGLTDYDELKVYHTDPLVQDTDGDSIFDGDEIRFGLDPLTPSDLTTVFQTLSDENIAEELRTGNSAVPSLSGYSAFVLDRNILLSVCDAEAVIQNPAIIGRAVYVEMTQSAALTLRFALADSENAVILAMGEDGSWTIPEANYADDGLSLEINESGIYCVADALSLLQYVGAFGGPKKGKDGTDILLSDFQHINLAAPLTPGSDTDTDGDGLTDWEELGQPYEFSLSTVIDQIEDTDTSPKAAVKVYPYKSNPALPDTDYDGIEDTYDNAANNNIFPGTMTASSNNCGVSYTMNYRWFFSSPYTYNQALCNTSIVLATMIYEQGAYKYDTSVRYSGGTVSSTDSIVTFLRLHGFENPVDYNYTGYTDDDISEMAMGHRTVTYNGQTKHIVVVDIRGTNGTEKEWSSNFDLGDHSTFNSISDWVHYYNHKGFDVAATRALNRLTTYTNAYTNDGTEVVYWIMGHSRGAAIANILSADLIDQGKSVFGYTFATPNTTTRKLAHDYKYSTIYNVVNEDDFVPCVPMDAWSFMRYGKTAKIDMTDAYQNEWHTVTGSSWYNEMADSKLSDLCTKLAAVASGWDDCYKYHCSCHGDGTRSDMTEDGLSYDEVYSDYSARARKYCKISTYTNFWGTTKYKACQLPAFFMQALADVMAASGFSMVTTLTGYDLAARYEPARDQVIICAAAGIADPHLTETYYVLAQHATSSLFTRGTISTCTHSYAVTSTLTAAACTAKGQGIYTCSKCGDKYKGEIAALGHNYVAGTVTAPTCTAQGYTKYNCSRCSATKNDNYTSAAGHRWGASTTITPATETSAGLAKHTCTVCGMTENETLPMLEHTHRYTDTVTALTCTEQGYTTHTCTCGESYKDSYTDALGHSETAPVTENIITESCTTDGGFDTVIYCETCHSVLSSEHTTIPANGHSFEEGVMQTAATCDNSGTIVYTCSVCGATDSETIPALGHSYSYTEAENGTMTGVCDTCHDTVYKYRISYNVPDFANTPDGGMYDAGASFELPEIQTVCGYVHMGYVTAPITEADTEPAYYQKGSTYTVSGSETLYAVFAYYKANGAVASDIYYSAYTGTTTSLVTAMTSVGAKNTSYNYRETYVAPAVYCYGYEGTAAQNTALLSLLKKGMLIDPEKVSSLDKYYTTAPSGCVRADTVTQAPTCTQEGYCGASCSHCDYFEYTVIAALGHSYAQTDTQAATCTQDGYAVMTCTECADTYTQTLPAGGHSFENGICSGCDAVFRINSAYLRLNENINMVYAVSIPDGFENPHMVFNFLGETSSVNDYTVNESGEYCFELTKIVPQYMGENISATVYASCNGTAYSDTMANYSVKTYCENQLAKFPNDAKLKTLLSDLLTYGAAAQVYTGYRADFLVTDGLALVPSTYPALTGQQVSFTGRRSDTADWKAATLLLSNELVIRFTFTAQSVEKLTVQCSLNSRAKTFDADDFISCGDGLWYVDFRGIKATEFDDTVTASFAQNGTQVGRTVGYSVNTYICSTQNSTAIPGLAQLVQALYNYGKSAEEYR